MSLLTIFTPTYNRADLIVRLYDSLCGQLSKNFEWIVVDDESDDGTDKLFETLLSKDCGFKISYYKQKHGGKHRAINYAVENVNTEYFFIVDSDDFLTCDAVQLIESWIEETKDIKELAGFSGLCMFPNGEIVGEYPSGNISYVDASNLQRYKLKLNGDKAEIYRTDLLKKFPFPEFENEYFVTERLCWDAIAAAGYKMRWYNKKIYICEYLPGGLTDSGANSFSGHINNFKGFCLFVGQSIKIWDKIEAVTIFREYIKTAKIKHLDVSEKARLIGISKFEYFIWYFIRMTFWYSVRILQRVVKKLG